MTARNERGRRVASRPDLGPVLGLVLALIAALSAGCGVVPPSRPAVDILVEKEVADLKDGLRSPDSAEPLRLYERMDDLGVGLVSIALVNEGELRWARSFGETSESEAPEAEREAEREAPGEDESKTGVFPTPGRQEPITEFSESVDVGDLAAVPLAMLALRSAEDPSDDESLEEEILEPLEMTQSRFENGRLVSTAEDLAKLVTDLQKAHAGKPARRLRQEQAQWLFGTGPYAGASVDAVPPLLTSEPPFDVDGEGQAVHFERRAATADHLIVLVGFVFSGHGAVVVVDQPDAGVLVDEILSGLAELYDWPAYRAESPEEESPEEGP